MFFVWLFSYGIVTMLSHHFSSWTPWAIPAGLLINTLTLVGWLLAKQQGELLGFKKISLSHWKIHLFFLPYLLPVLYHLLCFGFQPRSVPSILGIFFAAVLEEVIFRGILLHFLCRRGYTFGMVLSSILFAAAHLVNFENGAEPAFLLYQVVFALAVGFAFAGIRASCGSLLPCIGIHFLINITASDSLTLLAGSEPLFWLCIIVCLACGIRSICFLRKTNYTEKGYPS